MTAISRIISEAFMQQISFWPERGCPQPGPLTKYASWHVAQTASLLYRRLPVGIASQFRARRFQSILRRLAACDTADWQSALRLWQRPWSPAAAYPVVRVGPSGKLGLLRLRTAVLRQN